MASPDLSPTESVPGADVESLASDPTQFLRLLWRRRRAFLACLVLVPAAVLGLSLSATKKYQSSTLMQVSGGSSSGVPPDSVAVDQAPSPTAVNVAARLIQTSSVATGAAAMLHPAVRSPGVLLSEISVQADSANGFLTLTATDTNPQRAADIANAFAQAIVQNQSRQALTTLNQAVSQLQAQVHALADPLQKRQLSAQLQRLRALRAVQNSNIFQVEPAAPSGSPVSPRPVRNTALALLVAILIGIAVVFLLDRIDSRVREPEEIESVLGTTLLSVIPRDAFRGARGGATREAFHALRMGLTYFNVDRPLNTILVTSALKEEGKTTVAINLALVSAMSGREVILLETDLRRPAIAKRLGISSHFGLSEVLIGKASLFEALVEVPLPNGNAEIGAGRLRVLSSGVVPPSPPTLLGSERMRTLLEQLAGGADLVVVDSAPVLAVSDSVPLISETTGVIVVGRLNVVRREALKRLERIITTAGGVLVGAVATGATQDGIYGYGYGYGYAPDGEPQRVSRRNGGAPKGKPAGPREHTQDQPASGVPAG